MCSLVCSEILHGGLRNGGFKWGTQRVWAPSENQYKQSSDRLDRCEKVKVVKV